jgi:hypothetical protein
MILIMRRIVLTYTLISLLLCGCETRKWNEINLNQSMDDVNLNGWENDGGIPEALSDWEVIADISDSWFSCNYGYILGYTKMSIDQRNNIWIYGPDQWNSPFGIMPDNPGCEEDVIAKVIEYNSTTGDVEQLKLDVVPDAYLISASGWTHLDDEKVLLSSVHLFASPWDEGGIGNEFFGLSYFEKGKFHPLSEDSGGYWTVPDYSIYENLVYAIFNVNDPEYKIRIYDIETGQLLYHFMPAECKTPDWIEVNGENIFLICKDNNNYKLNIYANDFTLSNLLPLEDTTSEEFPQFFPLAFDTKGNLWIGYSYIATKNGDQWEIEELYEENDFTFQFKDKTDQRTIINMIPYKDGMFYNLEGAFYIGNYEEKEWRKIIHNSRALAVAEGVDGKLYAFTGKYILAGEP